MTAERLHYMANQIARNLAARGAAEAAAQTAQHITRYWSPDMRAALLASDSAPLEPIARAALDHLRKAAQG